MNIWKLLYSANECQTEYLIIHMVLIWFMVLELLGTETEYKCYGVMWRS